MPKYIVENTATEKRSEHGTWSAAMRAAAKAGDSREVIIIERDRDGERVYNPAGEILGRDGHWVTRRRHCSACDGRGCSACGQS